MDGFQGASNMETTSYFSNKSSGTNYIGPYTIITTAPKSKSVTVRNIPLKHASSTNDSLKNSSKRK